MVRGYRHMSDLESHFSHNDRHATSAKVILFRHHDLCRHTFSHRKHHPTRDCKCVLGDEASVVPFRKEVRQRQELRIIQAVAILHGCPKLLMPSSLLERSTPSNLTRSPPSGFQSRTYCTGPGALSSRLGSRNPGQ